MKTIPRCLALLFALAWLASGVAARSQTSLYVANGTTAVPQPGVVHFLQVVRLAQGPGTYTLNTITFSAYFTATDPQNAYFYFYTGVDTDPNSTDVLAHATLCGAQGLNDTPPTTGGYAFPVNNDPLITVTTDRTGSVGIEVFLITPDPNDPNGFGTFSQTAYGRFTAFAPALGSADGYVWNDADLNSVFTGAEQTRFGMANANTRLSLTGSLLQPTPSLKTFARSGTTATLTVDSYNGVNYQLQRASSLMGNWTNVGNAVAGSTGTVLTFTDTDGTDQRAFYRVMASLPTAGKAAVRKRSSLGL